MSRRPTWPTLAISIAAAGAASLGAACGSEGAAPSETTGSGGAPGMTTTGGSSAASTGGGGAGGAGGGGGGALPGDERLRVIVETDLGGDRDDQSSLVRFLMYANEWDVEGILIDRHPDEFQQDGLASNPTGAATALEMASDYLAVYGRAHTNLAVHDPRYPTSAELQAITVAAHDEVDAGVELLIQAMKKDDPRPLWYGNWGSNSGTESNLKRALTWLETNEPASYPTYLSRLRVATLDGAEPRLTEAQAAAITPYVETGFPQLTGDIESRWYRRFDDITGPFLDPDDLHAFEELYMGEKEGDTWSFVYLLPNGLNAPEHPTWGGAAGRYLVRDLGDNHYWNDAEDTYAGTTNRDNTALPWAEALQNDFKARLDWAVEPTFEGANHPPTVVLEGSGDLAPLLLTKEAGTALTLSLAGTSDPDGDALTYGWRDYPEAGTYGGAGFEASADAVRFDIPSDAAGTQIHLVVTVTDDGSPPLTRYRRVVVDVVDM